MATKLVEQVMDVAFGQSTREDLQQFFFFGSLLGHLNANQSEMQQFFRAETVQILNGDLTIGIGTQGNSIFAARQKNLG